MVDFETGIDALYTSLSDRRDFDHALRKLQQTVRAHAFHVLVVDPVTLTPITGLCPATPEGHDVYISHYAEIDPRLQYSRNDSYQAIDINRIFSDHSHRNSPVYNEFLKNYDAQVGVSVIKKTTPTTTLVFSSFRPKSFNQYEQEEISRIEVIARNLIRILSFRMLHSISTGEANETSVIFIDNAKCVIGISNKAESELTRFNSLLKITNRKVWATHQESDCSLQNAIDKIISTKNNISEDIIIKDNLGKARCIATVQGNISEPVLDTLLCAPKAIIHFRKIETQLKISKNLLREVFDLTPTEAIITCLLCYGESPQNIAIKRNVSISTVRWTINNIFEKLEVSSQTNLISTVSRTPGMLK